MLTKMRNTQILELTKQDLFKFVYKMKIYQNIIINLITLLPSNGHYEKSHILLIAFPQLVESGGSEGQGEIKY